MLGKLAPKPLNLGFWATAPHFLRKTMPSEERNKKKIINDPVYGFITIKTPLIHDVIQHPYFQRLRRIKQLGLTGFVYPGALHTRFHHALGAMHLMGVALSALKNKGHRIGSKEYEAAQLAILLHDIGHGPFSHALENTILKNVPHEALSLLLMEHLDKAFKGRLGMAIKIFKNTYRRPFFHQLVSSQLDMDRLDYLQRDCFFTGVIEGKIGVDRIIRMLNLHEEQIVVEEKGIYSIENFLNARRLMYWQVYLHKTTVSTEQMLIQLIRRARFLVKAGQPLQVTPALGLFLAKNLTLNDFTADPAYLEAFASIDDYDVWGSIKYWVMHPDPVLSQLSRMLLDRNLFKVEFSNNPPDAKRIKEIHRKVKAHFGLAKEDAVFLYASGSITNAAYMPKKQNINILDKHGALTDIAKASDLPNISALSKIVRKHYLCYPKVLAQL